MKNIATLIGAPSQHSVTNALSQEAWQALRSLGAQPADPVTLSDGEAIEIEFSAVAPAAARQSLIELTREMPVDIAVTSSHDRRKRLLVADMDSTIITVECIDELAGLVGARDEVATITERAMRGELEFEDALRHRVSLLKGMTKDDLSSVLENRVSLTAGARTLVQTMKANGATSCLVSGGFTTFTTYVADQCGFDHDFGNQLQMANGVLTGEVEEPILGQQAKVETLIQHRSQLQLLAHETIAVGDGANDAAMLTEAGLGVAFHAKPIVEDHAEVSIRHGDLTALLYVQGYHRSEFVD